MKIRFGPRGEWRSLKPASVHPGMVQLDSFNKKVDIKFEGHDDAIEFALSILGKQPALELAANPQFVAFARMALAVSE